SEIGEGREDRRACTDGNALLATSQCEPRVVAFAVAERAVKHGDTIAERAAEAGDRLRREGDLGNEHDRALSALLDERAEQRDVDERFAAPGDAMKKEGFTGARGA